MYKMKLVEVDINELCEMHPEWKAEAHELGVDQHLDTMARFIVDRGEEWAREMRESRITEEVCDSEAEKAEESFASYVDALRWQGVI